MKTKIIDSSYSEDLNNLYRPTSEYSLESFDLVDLQGCFSKKNSRFLPIVLKEWFALLKVKGTMKISYNLKSSGITPSDLEKTLWWLFKRNYKISSQEHSGDLAALSLVKESSVLKKEDGIDHWTFGMVTNGVRRDFIGKSIESIRNLKIPNYEIIICGTYSGKIEKDMKYVEFKKRDDRGWITRKKNLIAEKAMFSNLCIFHDRIIFNKDWYTGMKKYGNNFEVLTCIQKLSDGMRAGDWLSTNAQYADPGFMYKIEELDYRDWNRYAYVAGQMTIIKKYVWEEESWNETIYWKEAEDIEYSLRLTQKGFLPRFNPFSSCLTMSWRFGKLPKKQFNYDDKKASLFFYLHDVPIRRLGRLIAYYLIKIPKANSVIRFLYPLIVNTRLYALMKEH